MPRKFFDRLKRIDSLISLKNTGVPADLAEKLEISESILYEFIGLMKELGAPIKWDNYRKTYIYETEGRMELKFLKK
jgi:predicted DNA-binding transcriptional regulator YafY